MAKKQEIDHTEQLVEEITKLKEGFDILAEAVTQLNQQGLRAKLTQDQLDTIVEAGVRGVKYAAKDIKLYPPDLTPQADRLASEITSTVCRSVGNSVTKKVDETLKKHKLEVKHDHQHHHYNFYGTYASSEKNRNMMVWLAFITVLSLGSLILFVLKWYNLITWSWDIFPALYISVIAIILLGFLIRLTVAK